MDCPISEAPAAGGKTRLKRMRQKFLSYWLLPVAIALNSLGLVVPTEIVGVAIPLAGMRLWRHSHWSETSGGIRQPLYHKSLLPLAHGLSVVKSSHGESDGLGRRGIGIGKDSRRLGWLVVLRPRPACLSSCVVVGLEKSAALS